MVENSKEESCEDAQPQESGGVFEGTHDVTDRYGTLTNWNKSLHCARSEDLAGPRCCCLLSEHTSRTTLNACRWNFQNSQTHVLLLPARPDRSVLVGDAQGDVCVVVC
ncbi:hypothetical protein Zmor_014857 [Zophobas morio]|uniref:Uncharacterized protein n=1 Tax=Zophobas morio TaxID=2755281 RepID=A0AA38IGA2_9CUCU|nr:hypothetical protein Zmor_014857 [Zophobas morio]